MKILLLEDDAFFSQRIQEYLQDNGFETITMRSAQEAMQAELKDYVAAIIDIMLPNDSSISGISAEEVRGGYLTGIAVARRFRRQKEDFPIIFLSSDITGGEAKQWAIENAVPFVFKYEERARLLSALAGLGLIETTNRPRTFIVHGHDEILVAELKNYLQNTLKWPEPIVLREQPNCGRTIIEKFEDYAGIIDWVFVLLSPDDCAISKISDDEKRRARQNVIFELGFFYALLGRREGRVIVLKKGDVELPSDIQGVVWLNANDGIRACGEDIRKEVGC